MARHQMSVNAKTENITRSDLEILGDRFAVRGHMAIFDEVRAAVGNWRQHAAAAGVPELKVDAIAADMAAFEPV